MPGVAGWETKAAARWFCLGLLANGGCAQIAGLSPHHLDEGPSSWTIATLAMAQQQPTGIAVDGAHVFWTQTTQAMSPGSVAVIAENPAPGDTPAVLSGGADVDPNGSLALDASNVYWAAGQLVLGTSKTAGQKDPNTVLNDGLSESCYGQPVRTVFVSGTVLFASDGCGAVGRVNTNASSATPLVAGNSDIGGLVADAENVYFSDSVGHQILSVSVNGAPDGGPGIPSVFASGQAAPGAMAIDATTVYWISGNMILKLDTSAAGQAPVVLAQSQDSPTGIAVDDNDVYWTNTGPTSPGVMALPKSGDGDPIVITAGLMPQPVTPFSIAADDTGVYWVDQALGTVMAAQRIN